MGSDETQSVSKRCISANVIFKLFFFFSMGCKLSLDIRDVDQRSAAAKLPVIPYHKDGSTSPPRLSFKDVSTSPIVENTKIQEEVIEEDYKPDGEVDIYSAS